MIAGELITGKIENLSEKYVVDSSRALIKGNIKQSYIQSFVLV